jgi:hypothetical protein
MLTNENLQYAVEVAIKADVVQRVRERIVATEDVDDLRDLTFDLNIYEEELVEAILQMRREVLGEE